MEFGWLFFAGFAGILALSWRSLQAPGHHGFARFFAFSAIWGLAALRFSAWFVNPFSLPQVISWFLLLGSGFLALHGFYLLRQMGQPGTRASAGPNLAFENTSTLVRTGAYRWIRHPMYSSLFLLAWGIYFKTPDWTGLGLALVASTALYITARVEEGENLTHFGAEYRAYMQETKMFIPYIF